MSLDKWKEWMRMQHYINALSSFFVGEPHPWQAGIAQFASERLCAFSTEFFKGADQPDTD